MLSARCESKFGQIQMPVEYTHEIESDALRISDSSNTALMNGEHVPHYQQLLLEIFSNINEPDGIYGLQRNQR